MGGISRASVSRAAARMLSRVQHFIPSQDPAEGLGVLMLFRLIEEALPAFFQAGRPIQIARAPGRLDVLGGLGGHSALSLATAEAACVAIQARDDELVRLWSPCRDGSRTQLLSVRLSDLVPPEGPVDYEDARALLVPDPRDRWAAYVLGGLLVLAREHAVVPRHGAEVLINSDVPSGCGVGASTAVTVASVRAFALAYDVSLSASELARLAQLVEQEVLRSAPPAADAQSSVLAERGELLQLRGPAADLERRLQIPSDLEFIGLETGPRDAATAAGEGDALLVDGEAARAARFVELLEQPPSEALRRELGDVLFASHDAYRAAGRSNSACDLVVDFLRGRRDAGGAVLGARVTGRGGGGTVVLVGEHGKVWYEALRAKKALNEASGHSGHVFRWSSPGAASFGSIDLDPK
jgi:galactokinase